MDDKTARDIKMLCSYIPYFENIDPNKACKWITPTGTIALAGNYEYEDKLELFVRDVSNSSLMDCDYIETITRKMKGQSEISKEIIKSADLKFAKAILTQFVRGERFCDGTWYSAVKDNIFLSVLQRLESFTNC